MAKNECKFDFVYVLDLFGCYIGLYTLNMLRPRSSELSPGLLLVSFILECSAFFFGG